MNRVVITGLGLNSPIGNDLDSISESLRSGRHGIVRIPEWEHIDGLETRLGGRVEGVTGERWPRQARRSMGRVGLLAAEATEDALNDAGLDRELCASGEVGLAYGSTHGSSEELERFCRTVFCKETFRGVPSASYLRFMSHTCAANLAHLYGIRGRIITTCSACVSASQAVGYGYEAVRAGVQEVMICGGAEELHYVHAGVFDVMQVTSTKYDDPGASPRPFDADRDGLVVGEGAGTVILESLERAEARGAKIYAEVVGYGTNCDGTHVTSPSGEGMERAMRLALDDARLGPDDLDYVNAHATGTDVGDVQESLATFEVVGDRVPVSSTKGFTGHTLGACGTIELAFCIAMMRDGFLAPSRNLDRLDPACAKLRYVTGEARSAAVRTVMTNNFAFGGINTSLIVRRP